eukprot:426212-Prymnesium_polylepis.1
MERLDKNKDGVVNFKEFHEWYITRRKVVDVQVSKNFNQVASMGNLNSNSPTPRTHIDGAGAKKLLKQ